MRALTRRDRAPLLLLWAGAAALHAAVLSGGGVYFSNDLTHISFPWRVLTAEQLQRGMAPLWNPYSHFGIPLLANMQTGVFYPLSILFQLFPFAVALGPFVFLQQCLAALWTYLWLRGRGHCRAGACSGAALFALGGFLLGYTEAPNLQGTVAFIPALLLFSGRPALLACAAAISFLAGYPPFWLAGAGGALFLSAAWPPGETTPRERLAAAAKSLAGLALGAGIAAAVWLPGAELAAVSTRAQGMGLMKRMGHAMKPAQMAGFVRPELAAWLGRERRGGAPQQQTIAYTRKDGVSRKFTFTSSGRDTLRGESGTKFVPHVTSYIGATGFLLALIGFAALARRRPWEALLLAAGAVFVGVLLIGPHSAFSRWLWEKVPPFTLLRGPGRLSFLLALGAAPLAAWGADCLRGVRVPGVRLAALLPLLIVGELVLLGRGFYPTLPEDYYREGGELVGFLRSRLGSAGYFQRFTAAESWAYVNKDDPSREYREFKEDIFRTFKQRLYGIGNAVYHLPAGSGDFEPLIPAPLEAASRELIAADAGRREALMRWMGLRFWLARAADQGPPLVYRGPHLWYVYEAEGERTPAYWLPSSEAAALRGPLAAVSAAFPGRYWGFERPREDEALVRGTAPGEGTVCVAQTAYGGWQAFVNGKAVPVENAFGLFLSVAVPAGPVEIRLRYRPWTYAAGCWMSLLFLSALAAAGWTRRPSRTIIP